MMIEDNKMFRLSLQFFGDGDDDDDDFTEDFFDDDVPEYYGADNEDEDLDEDLEEDLDGGADGDPSSVAEAADNGASKAPPPTSEGEGLGADGGADGDPSSVAEAADNGASKAPPPTSEGEGLGADDANADLISELRALGYVGDDLAALTADMRVKREAQAAEDAKAEAAVAKAEGKNHIRSGKPGKSAVGDGTGGVSEHQVARMVESTGCTREAAREKLARHARLIEGK